MQRKWPVAIVVALILLVVCISVSGAAWLVTSEKQQLPSPPMAMAPLAEPGPALAEPTTVAASTAGKLQVTTVQPPDEAADVPLDTTITVVFNRPVVALSSEVDQRRLPQPLTFKPEVKGNGEWVNTAIYRFTPAQPLLPLTTYHVTVAAGLKDVSGTQLERDYTWSFTTVAPGVLSFSPAVMLADELTSPLAKPTDPIKIEFAQPMDKLSVEARLVVALDSPSGPKIEGSIRWSGNTLVFTPKEPWPRGGVVYVKLARAKAVGGATLETMAWVFKVVEELRLLASDPTDGAKGVQPGTSVRLWFSAPVDAESLEKNLRIEPKPDRFYVYWENDRTAWVDFGPKAATTYTITISANLKDFSGGRLNRDVKVSFSTGDYQPSFSLLDGWHPWAYGVEDEAEAFVSYRNISRLDFALYSLSEQTFVRLNSDDWQFQQTYTPNRRNLMRTWSVQPDAPRNQWGTAVTNLAEDGGPLPAGLYYLIVTAPEFPKPQPWEIQRQTIIVSVANVTLKTARGQGLAWVTGWHDGLPKAGVPVRFLNAQGRTSGSGVTDADGVYLGALTEQEPWRPYFAFVGSEDGDDFGVAISNWTNGINPWKYDIPQSGYAPAITVYLYTDRAIYRPGQTVYFKGIIRLDEDARYSVPKDLPELELMATDSQGQELLREPITVNDMGTFSGSLTLAADAPLGTYSLWLPIDEMGTGFGAWFQVAEYRRPEFEVNVSTDKDEYLHGDKIAVTAQSSYYFGGPVADAAVHWTVLSQDYFFYWQGEGYYDFTDYDYWWQRRYFGPYGEVLTEGDGQTDSDGRFTFSVPADISERTVSQTYTIEVTVTDINNQAVSSRTSVVVHKGEFYIGLKPVSYVSTAGEKTAVDVITVDSQSQPVPNRKVELTFYEHRWFNVREQVDGSYVWKTTEEDKEVGSQTVTTDRNGKAQASFVPKTPGTYKVVAVAKDDRGNEIHSSTYLWVAGEGYVSWAMQEDYTIQLITDKKSYDVGDRAQVLIPSPYSGPVKVLFTTERGKVIDYRVLEAESSSQLVEVPITAEYAPNIYFVAVLMRGADEEASLPAFQVGYGAATVATEALQIQLSMTPDRSGHYEPRDTATFKITATDSEGKPVQAELSLDMVDKSVLALTDQSQPSIVAHFYSQRGLGVQTAVTMSISAEQLKAAAAEVGKGGGGGGGPGEGVVRERFPETAYWEPALRTDKNGVATVSIELPDNLTTWSLEAKAVTADTLVAQEMVEIVATKDLLLRPVLPRFLVAGDKAIIGAVVHNNSEKSLNAKVTCEVAGLVGSLQPQQVTVAPGGKVSVTWEVEAKAIGEATITLSAKAGSYSDAVRQTLPIYAMTTVEVVATSGQVGPGETRQEAVAVPSRYQAGELNIQVEASLAASMIPGLEYLKHYPYECAEQTVSRFLPNIATARALRDLGIEDVTLVQSLAEQVAVALQRLYGTQHEDGGWGWWYSDRSNPYLTAYAVLGLAQARDAGYSVDKGVLNRAVTFLLDALRLRTARSNQDKDLSANVRAYIAYVLAEAGEGDLGASVSLFERRSALSNRGKAYLLMALAKLSPDEQSRLDTLRSDLEGAAIVAATSAHWEDEADWRTMGTDAVTTAAVIQALSRTRPDSYVLPSAVRWLMARREDGHWRSTYETASTILALTDYIVASGELDANYAWQVGINDKTVGSGVYNAENLTEKQLLTVAIAKLLSNNSVSFTRQPVEKGGPDTGTMYYTMSLRYFPPAEELQAVNAGIIVARQYVAVDDSEKPVDSAAVNDMIQVKLTIIAPSDLYHVVIEDPFPAGCEGVDTSLKTTTVAGVQPEFVAKDEPWGWWWFSQSEIRDDKMVLFATFLPAGAYEYTYYIRASVPGEFNVRPLSAYQMYFPDVYGHSEGMRFTVR